MLPGLGVAFSCSRSSGGFKRFGRDTGRRFGHRCAGTRLLLRDPDILLLDQAAPLAHVGGKHGAQVLARAVATWIGAFAPAGTPKAILDKIEAAIKQALAAPDVRAKLEALSMEIRSGAGEELRAVLAADMGKWGRLVKEKNIRIAQ